MTEEARFDLTDLDGAAWVSLDAATYEMGSRRGRDDARPVRGVRLSAFRVSRYPVTNAQYAAFVLASGTPAPEHWLDGAIPDGKADHPVTYVSWLDAQAYCAWLTEEVGAAGQGGAHLPTEAQWEFVARGTAGRDYPWGDEAPTPEHTNFQESGIEDTAPVGVHPAGATPDDVHDLAGNVRQWCQDWYGRYGEGPEEDPTGPGEGLDRMLRGSSFVDSAGTLRSGYRFNIKPDDRYGFIGFRVAWSDSGLDSRRGS